MTDRLKLVWSVILQLEFLPLVTFDHLDINDRSQEAIDWVDVPWFRRVPITVGKVCERYTDAEDRLPCGECWERYKHSCGGSTSAPWIEILCRVYMWR